MNAIVYRPEKGAIPKWIFDRVDSVVTRSKDRARVTYQGEEWTLLNIRFLRGYKPARIILTCQPDSAEELVNYLSFAYGISSVERWEGPHG